MGLQKGLCSQHVLLLSFLLGEKSVEVRNDNDCDDRLCRGVDVAGYCGIVLLKQEPCAYKGS